MKTVKPLQEREGYASGHPWYYLRGGTVPTPKQIQAEAIASDYCGYMADDIRKIDKMSEPRRSEKLRELQTKFKADLVSDLSRYRKVVRELHHQRKTNRIIDVPVCCSDVHTAMSLKNAHLYNDFAHLHFIEGLLGKQLDLFEERQRL